MTHKVIKVITSDNKVWNTPSVYVDIVQCMAKDLPFELDFCNEGPDIGSLGFYDFLYNQSTNWNYDLSKIVIRTSNALEQHHDFCILYMPPMHLVENSKDYDTTSHKQHYLKHFAIFINRSNAERLFLASYLYSNHRDKTLCTYHFNIDDDFYANNIGLENLVKHHRIQDLQAMANFLSQCPIKLTDVSSTGFDKNSRENPAQQLLKQDKDSFVKIYENFFLEIVCESYFSGTSFFPTEKIWRPIIKKTPFIVQGSQFFLNNLRKLGFKTFNSYWDEGYSEDPSDHQLKEIIKVLDWLSQKSSTELISMFNDMKPILEHNYEVLQKLKDEDFFGIT